MEQFPRNRAIRYFWLCCALCAALQSSGAAAAQTILLHLRNGDRLSGSLIAEESASLTISNSVLGKVAVPLAQIEKRETLSTVAVAIQPYSSNANAEVASPVLTISPAAQKRLVDLQTVPRTHLPLDLLTQSFSHTFYLSHLETSNLPCPKNRPVFLSHTERRTLTFRLINAAAA